MLLRHKKIQDRDQNWCIILNPLKNEIDKKRVVQKIAQVFALSVEEAQDLAANTPIILLDNLDRDTAVKVKDYFRPLGAEMAFTNDVFQKRKCYRTIWPEPPSLSFLGAWPQLSGEKENHDQELLAPEDALNEIRSFVREDPKPSQSETVFQALSAEDRAKLLEEVEYWKEQYEILRDQVTLLKAEINQARASAPHPEASLTQQRELQDAQKLLAGVQENHRILQEEYRMACELYEDKCSALAKEAEDLKKARLELAENLQILRKEKQAQADQWDLQEVQFAKGLEDQRQSYHLLEGKLAQLNLELEDGNRKNREMTEKVWQLEKEKQGLAKALELKEEQYKKLGENYNHSGRIFEERLGRTLQELDHAKLQNRGLAEKIEVLLRAKESLEQTINEQAEQVIYWRDKQNADGEKIVELQRNYESERSSKGAFEIKQRELEDEQRRLVQELETKNQEAVKLQTQNQELILEAAGLREGRENLERTLQTAAKQLEIREKELEGARRQIREMNAHVEQRELIQKKTKIANQLVEKEALLQKLIKDQEEVESEIRAREGLMGKILNEQENLEKEIIEAKQTQKYLAEQAKKERPNRPPFGPEPK